jgi:hypothetical protein
LRLHERILGMDRSLNAKLETNEAANEVGRQLDELSRAFGTR